MALAPHGRAVDSFDPADFPLRFGAAAIMRGRIDRDGGLVTLVLAGELDLDSAGALATTLAEIEGTHPDAIVIDLQELGFMDSTGIRELAAAHERATGAHLFALLRGSGPAYRTLGFVGLDEHLMMVDRPSEVRALQG